MKGKEGERNEILFVEVEATRARNERQSKIETHSHRDSREQEIRSANGKRSLVASLKGDQISTRTSDAPTEQLEVCSAVYTER